jgi:hypothetical protein
MISFSHAEICDQILFYNSDTNINNYKQLKTEFDNFLKKIGNYTFQPINDQNIFHDQLKDNKNCMLIISSWYYNILVDRFTIFPFLIAHRNGMKTQQIILIKKKSGQNIARLDFSKGNIASSMSRDFSESMLNSILIDHHVNHPFNVLRVPKDIDALMAVGFGMSTYALSTYHSFKNLSKINPSLFNKLSCIGKKVDSFLMICAVVNHQHDPQLINAFVNMNKIPEGRNAIKMLGIDGFNYYHTNHHRSNKGKKSKNTIFPKR